MAIIGTVEFVSPKEIKVLLNNEAPFNISLNTGIPQPFPRVNGFLLIPNEAGAIIGMITWIGIEHASFPKHKGHKDYDIVDLPYPLRKLSLAPLGVLKETINGYEIERGVSVFPSVGDVVIIPSKEQLQAIVQNRDPNAKVQIGISPLAGNAPIYVDPDKLFGRHLAILGNTGSGKSCSIVGLIRSSIESAKKVNKKENAENKKVNARFIILDPNGEYEKCFNDLGNVKRYAVKLNNEENVNQLKIPSWMWNSQEWISITQASVKAQAPILTQALRRVKTKSINHNSENQERSVEDLPIFFKNEELLDTINELIREVPIQQQHLHEFFKMRINNILSDERISKVINTKDPTEVTLKQWLEEYIGDSKNDPSITIIDLSLVPSEILYLCVAVFARIVFEAHYRYKKEHGEVLPTVLVIDEAHNFIKHYPTDDENISSQQLCTQIFEKIAKEGRKFGIGLVIASQRPSELSQTVLSQCNTFILHRIVSDRDQEMVRKLVPDAMSNILNELSVLPSRKAIIVGWAVSLPTIVEINEIPKEYRPKSSDPDIWEVWTTTKEREVEWESIAKKWQKID